jgi:glycerol-3-phosphate cytidylyltransferase-like family protein
LVYVALNSDAWLTRKKGYVFQTWAERAEILRECRSVFHVLPVQDDDDTVCSAIMSLQSDYFANGGDRTTPNEKENIACKASGTKQLFRHRRAKSTVVQLSHRENSSNQSRRSVSDFVSRRSGIWLSLAYCWGQHCTGRF